MGGGDFLICWKGEEERKMHVIDNLPEKKIPFATGCSDDKENNNPPKPPQPKPPQPQPPEQEPDYVNFSKKK